jgi:hypothetical protein
MRSIKKYVDHIEEEIESAKEYAEKYVELKAKGENSAASKYREMAEDELKHANYIHEFAVKEIEQLSKFTLNLISPLSVSVTTPPKELVPL